MCSGQSQKLVRKLIALARNPGASRAGELGLRQQRRCAVPCSPPDSRFPLRARPPLPSPFATCTGSRPQTQPLQIPVRTTQMLPAVPIQNRVAGPPRPPGTTTSISDRCPCFSSPPLSPSPLHQTLPSQLRFGLLVRRLLRCSHPTVRSRSAAPVPFDTK
jgi:hypothetical protein